ncbi:hypothetical protein LC593_30575 [Nostoc sp. CHAB 5844]|nr:hypothetical protein [Nostoc sp. CHAB 5844]
MGGFADLKEVPPTCSNWRDAEELEIFREFLCKSEYFARLLAKRQKRYFN